MNNPETQLDLRDKLAELEMANCMLADFAALVSHDIRSALRRVIGYAELLAVVPCVNAQPETLDNVRSIIFATRKIRFLVDGALASPPSGQTTLSLNNPQRPLPALEQQITELQENHRLLTDFADSVARGLRAPLGQIASTIIQVASLTPVATNPVALEMTAKILSGADQMQRLIEDYLCFANAERHAIHRTRIPLNSLLQLIRHEFESMSAGRKITWRIAELPEVEADASMLRQVFVNILSNSLKFTYNCSEAVVEIGANRDSCEHIIFIRDNGVGFDLESAQTLFRKFVRLHDNTIVPGVGIGLVIVKHIIQRHHGRVWAEGTPGGGATFYFTLPAALQSAPRDSRA